MNLATNFMRGVTNTNVHISPAQFNCEVTYVGQQYNAFLTNYKLTSGAHLVYFLSISLKIDLTNTYIAIG